MARKPSPTLTDGELEIMEVLWDRSEATVRAVTDALSKRRDVAYSTVQTMLGILYDKGFVDFYKEGRAFVYSPLIDRSAARKTALRHLLQRFFGGSSTALAESLLDESDIDLLELERLRGRVRGASKSMPSKRKPAKQPGPRKRGPR